MSQENAGGFTRRAALVTGLAGATAAVLPAVAVGRGDAPAGKDDPRPGTDRGPASESERARTAQSERLPVVYVPHGGGPWPFVDLGFKKSEVDGLATYLRSLRGVPKAPPKALLVISAHWEEPVPTLMTSANPPMLYDYYGFPPDAYTIQWPAPGDPRLAARVQELLGAGGFKTASDAKRGFDHGTFVPFKLTYPDAEVPTVQLSLKAGLDPSEHLAMGRALAPLRDEGVFILGSGLSFHNLRAFRDPGAHAVGETFDTWLRQTAQAEPAERDRGLEGWSRAPAARQAHPREEHLLPLMVVAGAAGADRGSIAYRGEMFGVPISGFQFG